MKPSHTPEQILHSFIEKEKKVLQIGGDAALKDLVSPTEFRQMLLEELENLENIPNGYDYIVIGDVCDCRASKRDRQHC